MTTITAPTPIEINLNENGAGSSYGVVGSDGSVGLSVVIVGSVEVVVLVG